MGWNLVCLGFVCSPFVQGFLSQADVSISSTTPTVCWTRWINQDTPTTGDGDRESLTAVELVTSCRNGNITSIECITTDGLPSYSTGEIMECSIEHGSVCLNDDNYPMPCSDYKIRYLCECYIISTTTKSATTSPRHETAHVNTFTTSPRHNTTTVNTITYNNKGDTSRQLLSTWSIVLIAVGSTVILVTLCIKAIYVHKRFTKKKRLVNVKTKRLTI